MTLHTPLRVANSVMSAAPTSGSRVVLLDTGNYPSFSSYLNEVWTFNGTDWTNKSPSMFNSSPLPGRTDAVMAYTGDGTNVMLYGGRGATGTLQHTWLYNVSANTWTKSSPTTTPFGRYKANAAYLTGTGVVMFGGESAGLLLNETWVFASNNWSQVVTPNAISSAGGAPSARTGHAMAADATRVLLFGGRGTNYQSNGTYSFTAGAWTKLSPIASPSVRSECKMTYDPVNSIYVLFGGQNEYNYLPETWIFSVVANTWTKVPGAGPSGRVGHQMAFDATSGTTIMFGGVSATTNYPSNETWSFNGSTLVWTQL